MAPPFVPRDRSLPPSFSREPPRAPKALVGSARGSGGGGGFGPYGPRGRGGYGGGRTTGSGGGGAGAGGGDDFRDRSRDRDPRDGPSPFRREGPGASGEREWVRRDRGMGFNPHHPHPHPHPHPRDFSSRDFGSPRDFNPRDRPPSFGRGRTRSRSRSPPLRDFRDAPLLRDPEQLRRRSSRDGPPGLGLGVGMSGGVGSGGGPPDRDHHLSGPPLRGGFRGRGRGDRERGRGRGRGFFDDRSSFSFSRRRSRSRDTWRERERDRDFRFDRERERERDRDRRDRFDRFDRFNRRDRDRDDERRSERDDRRGPDRPVSLSDRVEGRHPDRVHDRISDRSSDRVVFDRPPDRPSDRLVDRVERPDGWRKDSPRPQPRLDSTPPVRPSAPGSGPGLPSAATAAPGPRSSFSSPSASPTVSSGRQSVVGRDSRDIRIGPVPHQLPHPRLREDKGLGPRPRDDRDRERERDRGRDRERERGADNGSGSIPGSLARQWEDQRRASVSGSSDALPPTTSTAVHISTPTRPTQETPLHPPQARSQAQISDQTHHSPPPSAPEVPAFGSFSATSVSTAAYAGSVGEQGTITRVRAEQAAQELIAFQLANVKPLGSATSAGDPIDPYWKPNVAGSGGQAQGLDLPVKAEDSSGPERRPPLDKRSTLGREQIPDKGLPQEKGSVVENRPLSERNTMLEKGPGPDKDLPQRSSVPDRTPMAEREPIPERGTPERGPIPVKGSTMDRGSGPERGPAQSPIRSSSPPLNLPKAPKADRMESRAKDVPHRPGRMPAAPIGPSGRIPELKEFPPQSASDTRPHETMTATTASRSTTPIKPVMRPSSSSLSSPPSAPSSLRAAPSTTPSAPARAVNNHGNNNNNNSSNNNNNSTLPRPPFPSVPTGPRALQQRPPMAPRNGPKTSNQWVRPGYAGPRGPPSGMHGSGSLPSFRRDGLGEKAGPGGPGGHAKAKAPEARVDNAKMQDAAVLENSKSPEEKRKDKEPEQPITFESSGEESDEENELDEDYFNEGEKRFEKEIQLLRAEMPSPILEDQGIVDLLFRIQMLRVIATTAPEAKDLRPEPEPTKPEPGQASPHIDDAPTRTPSPIEVPVRTQTSHVPSIEDLPFLPSGPPTPFSGLEETIQAHHRLKNALSGVLAKQHKETYDYHQRLRDEYAKMYKSWRLLVMKLDRRKISPKPDTMDVSPPPPSALLEGRRGYKLNSELDFQNALKASALTAQQEELERQRQNEETAFPDMSKEAVIPDMLDCHEKRARVFKDTNQIVDPGDAFRIFAFYPAPDDFTPEEHKTFVDAFMQFPKKWGKIAEHLPNRTFQHCIRHYYMTKLEVKYKAKLNRRVVRRRRGVRAVKPPKTNALMSDLAERQVADGKEDAPGEVTVTDTGRPRRAAAPTFGDATETENGSGPGRRNGRDRDKEKEKDKDKEIHKEAAEQESSTNGSGTKPASRRGGRSGVRGGGRRSKSTAQSSATAASAKPTGEASIESTPDAGGETPAPPVREKEEEAIAAHERERGRETESLPPPQAVPQILPAPPSSTSSRSRSGKARSRDQTVPAAPSVGDGGEANLTANTNAPPMINPEPYGSNGTTSYWSVPETRDFPQLVAHFGKDWDSIAGYMKTKTATMVSEPPPAPEHAPESEPPKPKSTPEHAPESEPAPASAQHNLDNDSADHNHNPFATLSTDIAPCQHTGKEPFWTPRSQPPRARGRGARRRGAPPTRRAATAAAGADAIG